MHWPKWFAPWWVTTPETARAPCGPVRFAAMQPQFTAIPHAAEAAARRTAKLQVWRRRTQMGFFALFLLAPALNLLRFDLYEAQLWLLGQRWTLGIDELVAGHISATQAGWNFVWRALLPVVLLVAVFLGVAYRYGRLYCGWLCPHFSMVEGINHLLHRACGKLSLWDAASTARPGTTPQSGWWPLFALSCVLGGFVWAITLLTYLLPPDVIWGNLVAGTLTPNQLRFLVIGTAVFAAEFAFARHLFCRFGCAVGLFQSLVWMANPRGMVVAFDRPRARDCKTCQSEHSCATAQSAKPFAVAALASPCTPTDAQATATLGSACESVCPMRLKPRTVKRRMFSCVQCGQCISACDATQTAQHRTPTLQWHVGEAALRESLRQRRAEHPESHQETH
jgi:ferredoxin-type protein NapH